MRLTTRLACALALTLPILSASAALANELGKGTPSCDATLPPELGGCGPTSPYTAEMRAGVWGLGPNYLPRNPIVHGWIQLLNTGPDMPHLVIKLDSRKSFKVLQKFAQFHTVSRKYQANGRWLSKHVSPFVWDFGRFPAGSVATIRFRMRLTNRCSYEMATQAFGNIGSYQGYDPSSQIWNSQQSQGGSFSPCP
jgi:hypothetical protein